jgi:signal transduction histidine kinase
MQQPTPQERLLACFQQALGHDLPNKLVALQGIARLLDEELAGKVTGEARDWLARILGLTREIDNQVRALAEVGRACRQMGLVTTIDLAELWTEVGVEIACQVKDRSLSFAHSTALSSVVLPERALRRVLVEMARYGVARSPAGSTVRLALSTEPSGAEGLRLAQQDDGPAPDSKALERALEPRLDDPQGPALGLFLARLLVEAWGGTLSLSAPSEGGCLITVDVPHLPTPTNTGM